MNKPELPPLTVNEHKLEVVECAKLLVVTITGDLSWNMLRVGGGGVLPYKSDVDEEHACVRGCKEIIRKFTSFYSSSERTFLQNT